MATYLKNVLLYVVLGISFAYAQLPTPFPCKTAAACVFVGPNGNPQGWIAGEIRTFAFGTDSGKVVDEMAAKGWVECAGQSAIRKDFDELWRVIGSNWGTPDRFTFFVPDLRGMFLRGFNHGKVPPPSHLESPYHGDPDTSSRLPPRPEESGTGVGLPGVTGDHVGSVQVDRIASHTHPFVYNSAASAKQYAHDDRSPQETLVGGKDVPSVTASQAPEETETHPSNAYIMYFIYVGKPATIIGPSAADAKKGLTGTIRLKPTQ